MLLVMVLAVGGFALFAYLSHAHFRSMRSALVDAIRTGKTKPPGRGSSTSSEDLFGSPSSPMGASRPDEGMIAHHVAHHGLDAHGEALVRHHGMDPQTAALHSGSGGIGGGGNNDSGLT